MHVDAAVCRCDETRPYLVVDFRLFDTEQERVGIQLGTMVSAVKFLADNRGHFSVFPDAIKQPCCPVDYIVKTYEETTSH